MANYQIQAGTLFEDFETIGDWSSGSGGTLTASTTIFQTGTKSMKLVTDGSAANFNITKTISADFSRAGTISFAVYVENDTNTQGVTIFISSSTSFATSFQYTAQSELHEGWNILMINRSRWTNNSGEDWANTMVRLRVRVNAESAVVGTAYFDSMYIQRYNRPKAVIFFDDFPDTAYTVAYPYMRQYGMRATHAGVSSYPGLGGKCTLAQIIETHNAGWDVVNHTVNHLDLTTLANQAAMEAEISGCTSWMQTNGFTRNNEHLFFAYPLSGTNAIAEAALAAQNMIVARGNYNRSQAPQVDRQYLICGNANPSPVTLATIKAKIDRAIGDGGATFLYFHILATPEANSNYLDPATFYSVIDYIQSKREQIDVVTFTEWYYGITRNRRVV